MQKRTIQVPTGTYEALKELGDGNASKGARLLADEIGPQEELPEGRHETRVTMPEETIEKLRRYGVGSVSRALAILARDRS
jgi:hypothetical protein